MKARGPLLRLIRAGAIQLGDFAGHALSHAARDAMPRPRKVSRNTLRPNARPGAWERALSSDVAGRALLARELDTVMQQLRRVQSRMAGLSELAISLEDRATWEQLHAARMLFEDASTIARQLAERHTLLLESAG